MASRIFSDWQPEHSALWDRHPIKLQHTLHQSPLFSIDGLAALIDKYPRDLYMLVHMGEQGGQRFWREGDIAGMSGHDVIKAISQGRLWLNLRCVDEVDKRYADVQDQMFRFVELLERKPEYHYVWHELFMDVFKQYEFYRERVAECEAVP